MVYWASTNQKKARVVRLPSKKGKLMIKIIICGGGHTIKTEELMKIYV